MANYIYGRNPVLSAIECGKVKQCFVSPNFKETKILNALKSNKIKTETKNNGELAKLSNNGVHQGIIAVVEDYKYMLLNDLLNKVKSIKNPLILILDGIKDPHNFGAIIRVADAFGVNGIIIKKHNQVPVNMTVTKVSTGAIDFVDIVEVNNINNAIDTLKENGFWIVSTDGSAKDDYRDLDYNIPVALVIGSEGEGVSRLVLKNSDFIIKIQMHGHVNSLNASNAASVVVSHIVSVKK